MSIYYDRFITECIKRAERKDVMVDNADRFMALWVAFNGWLKKKYGESKTDKMLINKAKENEELKSIFETNKAGNDEYKIYLTRLEQYSVRDMRKPDDENRNKEYDGSYESLIEVIYQIRCNLFHGRKNVDEDEKDYELIEMAYHLLLPVFKEALRKDNIYLD